MWALRQARDDQGWGSDEGRVSGRPQRGRALGARWPRVGAGGRETRLGSSRDQPPPGARPHSRMRQGAADPMRGVACQVRGSQAQSEAAMRRTASARCPHRPGIDRRSAGAPRRHAMTRTGHAKYRQLLGEPIAVDFKWTRCAALVQVAVPRGGGLNTPPCRVPRGGPLGEPCSIRAGRRVRDGTPRFREWKRWKAITLLSVGAGAGACHPSEGGALVHPLRPERLVPPRSRGADSPRQ